MDTYERAVSWASAAGRRCSTRLAKLPTGGTDLAVSTIAACMLEAPAMSRRAVSFRLLHKLAHLDDESLARKSRHRQAHSASGDGVLGSLRPPLRSFGGSPGSAAQDQQTPCTSRTVRACAVEPSHRVRAGAPSERVRTRAARDTRWFQHTPRCPQSPPRGPAPTCRGRRRRSLARRHDRLRPRRTHDRTLPFSALVMSLRATRRPRAAPCRVRWCNSSAQADDRTER
jgi:hypothetical protein